MSRLVLGPANLFLLALMALGGWLANSSDIRLLIGMLLTLGSAAGFIFLARRENALPLAHGEKETWEITRAKGKRAYVLKSAVSGLVIGLIFIVYQLIRSRSTGQPATASYVFGLMVFLIIIYIGGSSYGAIRRWALYEERYKEFTSQEAQHNKSLNRMRVS